MKPIEIAKPRRVHTGQLERELDEAGFPGAVAYCAGAVLFVGGVAGAEGVQGGRVAARVRAVVSAHVPAAGSVAAEPAAAAQAARRDRAAELARRGVAALSKAERDEVLGMVLDFLRDH